MAQRTKKEEAALLIKWIVALSAVLAVMVGVAFVLSRLMSPKTAPKPTQVTKPTTSNSEFAYDDNGFLTCLTAPSIPGIDVSHHQGYIDWPQVKAAGVEFAMIRLGYRGYEDGKLHIDEQVIHNLAGARAAGIKIGAYFFSQATSEAEAQEEAQFALEILGATTLDHPLVFDWEYISDSARTASVDSETLMACVRTFCNTVEDAGFEPTVYFNQDLARTRLDLSKLDCPFWLAMYTDRLQYDYPVRFWQYTDSGTVPGIEGNVDLDLYFPLSK